MMKPRCGKRMLRYKSTAEGMTSCGRPAGHNGRHQTVEACRRYYAADVRRIVARRRQERLEARARVQAGAPSLRPGPSACGTYLKFLLHQVKGERCTACGRAAARRWAEQAVLDAAMPAAGRRERSRQRRAA